jgi:ABC-type uncharacterized transport system permease subunit
MTIKLVSSLTYLLYLSISVQQWRQLFQKDNNSLSIYWLGSILAIIGHGILLYKIIETPHGQNLVWPVLLSCIFWLMSILNLVFSIEQPSHRLSILMYPLASLSLLIMQFFPRTAIVDTSEDYIMLVHVLVSMIAVSFIFMAGFWAALLAIQHRLLKTRSHSRTLLLLPPIQTMENNLFKIIWIGVFFLTCSLLTGFIFDSNWSTQLFRAKTLFALFSWLFFVTLLLGQRFFGWRGTLAVKYTLLGVTLVTFSYFGTEIILN